MTTKNRLRAKVRPFAENLKAVGDIHRLSIVYLLAKGPLDAWQIVEYTGLSPSLIAHHLKLLFNASWVKKERHGKRVEYRLNPKAFLMFEKLFKNTVIGREVWGK